MTPKLLRKIGVRKIQMMAGSRLKILQRVFRSSHRNVTGTMRITAMIPMRSLKMGCELMAPLVDALARGVDRFAIIRGDEISTVIGVLR
jgi:hypothetical protein